MDSRKKPGEAGEADHAGERETALPPGSVPKRPEGLKERKWRKRKRTGKNVAILWDTKGPEFRSGIMENDLIELEEGKLIRIVKESVTGTKERFSVNHPSAIDSLKVGDTVLLENAKMKLEVISIESDGVTCKIISGGKLGSRKSMSVPGVKLDIPYISDIDRADIKYACEHGGEFLAISFVSNKENVLEVREILKEQGRENEYKKSDDNATSGI